MSLTVIIKNDIITVTDNARTLFKFTDTNVIENTVINQNIEVSDIPNLAPFEKYVFTLFNEISNRLDLNLANTLLYNFILESQIYQPLQALKYQLKQLVETIKNLPSVYQMSNSAAVKEINNKYYNIIVTDDSLTIGDNNKDNTVIIKFDEQEATGNTTAGTPVQAELQTDVSVARHGNPNARNWDTSVARVMRFFGITNPNQREVKPSQVIAGITRAKSSYLYKTIKTDKKGVRTAILKDNNGNHLYIRVNPNSKRISIRVDNINKGNNEIIPPTFIAKMDNDSIKQVSNALGPDIVTSSGI